MMKSILTPLFLIAIAATLAAGASTNASPLSPAALEELAKGVDKAADKATEDLA